MSNNNTKDCLPLTMAVLNIIDAVQKAQAFYIGDNCVKEGSMFNDRFQSWKDRCETLFLNDYEKAADEAGLSRSRQVLDAILRSTITEEMRMTKPDDLPVQYVFDAWLGNGNGGIRIRRESDIF
jgi:hypothetical protein